MRWRNTPTCVGKTPLPADHASYLQKHPHVRGENPYGLAKIVLQVRNTPTCVGKTQPGPGESYPVQKHPHVRGENSEFLRAIARQRETPPRAWGKPLLNVRSV